VPGKTWAPFRCGQYGFPMHLHQQNILGLHFFGDFPHMLYAYHLIRFQITIFSVILIIIIFPWLYSLLFSAISSLVNWHIFMLFDTLFCLREQNINVVNWKFLHLLSIFL
jgi:hypothetical protein